LDKLRRPDPILFFDEVDLYEDELGDNGMSLLSIKIRVMPARLLLLSRFFLRLDDVIFRVRDTRIYIEFETGQVIRDYTAMEGVYSKLKEVPSPSPRGYLYIHPTPNPSNRHTRTHIQNPLFSVHKD
jgi:type 2A phosphatase activator TIP41